MSMNIFYIIINYNIKKNLNKKKLIKKMSKNVTKFLLKLR